MYEPKPTREELEERIAKLTAERDARVKDVEAANSAGLAALQRIDELRAENTRLKAPVSDREIAAFRPWFMPDKVVKDRIELLIASRATRTPQADSLKADKSTSLTAKSSPQEKGPASLG